MITTLSGALVIFILVSLCKSLIEAQVPPSSPQHDTAIRLAAVALGVGGAVAHAAILAPLSAPTVWDAGQQGLVAAITAIATFHLTARNYFDATADPATPAASAPAPAAAVAPAAGYGVLGTPVLTPPAQ